MSAIIRREMFAGAKEGYCLPGGEYVIALDEAAVLTDTGRIACPEPLRYPVMTVGTSRGRCIAAQGASEQSRSTWECVAEERWTDDAGQEYIGRWFDRGPNGGERPTMYLQDGTLVIEPGGPNHPTEGWAGASLDGQPMRIIRYDALRDIHELTALGPFVVGQSSVAGVEIQFDGKRYLAEPGDTHTIWAVLGADGTLAIATRKLSQNETVLLWIDVNRLSELPAVTDQPPIIVIPPVIIDPPKEKDPMQFTPRQQEIVQQLYDRHLEWANGTDDDRRKLAKAIAEQFRFEFGEDWGWKSAHGNTENDAPGKDAIAHKRGPFTPGRQMLDIFDMFNGSTRKPNNPIQSVPEEESNQYFIPVAPVNHLEKPVDPPVDHPTDPPVDPPTADLAALVAKLRDDFSAFGGRLSAVERVGDSNAAQLKVSGQREADYEKRIAALEKGGGTGTGGGTPTIPVDLAKQIVAELLKAFGKLGAAA